MTQLKEMRTPEQERMLATITRAIAEVIRREEPWFYRKKSSSTGVSVGVVIIALARGPEAPVLIEAVDHYESPFALARAWEAIGRMAKAEAQSASEATFAED